MSETECFKYAKLPVFNYQTFDRDSCTFTDHPIIPPERIQFTDRNADDLYKPDPESEMTEVESPPNPLADDAAAEGGSKDDGMVNPLSQSYTNHLLDIAILGEDAAVATEEAKEEAEAEKEAEPEGTLKSLPLAHLY